MRKIIWQNMVTLDGFVAGPKDEIDWHVVDDSFFAAAQHLLKSLDGFIFGRRTYELMAGYWPTSTEAEAEPMNRLKKYVASRTLKKVEWNNSVLLGTDVVKSIKELKAQPGRDLAIFGSSDLVATLLPAGVIDEVRLFVAPLLLGAGLPNFRGVTQRMPFKLMSTQTLSNGVVLLTYQA